MSKMRSDSKWNELTEDQRTMLIAWLFEENLPNREVLERAEKEFGIQASLSSLNRFYQRLAEERLHGELRGLQSTHNKIEGRSLDWQELATTARTLVANRLIQIAIARPGCIRDLATLSRLMVSNEIAMVKRRWLELEEEKREMAERHEINRQAYHEALRIHTESAKGRQPTPSAPEPKIEAEPPSEPPETA
jgi:hypothetical protein